MNIEERNNHITCNKINRIKNKSEALSLTCNLASIYWNRFKMVFQIPLILTSSVMALLNSITDDGNDVKLANIVVNSVSVLIISLSNSFKCAEKSDNFKKVSQGFLLLVSEIENRESNKENNNKDLHTYNLKYDSRLNDIEFSDINSSIKKNVNMMFNEEDLPLQIRVIDFKKRRTPPSTPQPSPPPSVNIGYNNQNV